MSRSDERLEGPAGSPEADTPEAAEIKTRLAVLEEENTRLRREYARSRRSYYRRTAAALAALGVVALVGGFAFPASRTVLFSLAGTGLFAAVLTYYLAPERFIAASVGQEVYATLADTAAAVTSELGLEDAAVYVPPGDDAAEVRLFVPQRADYELPPTESLSRTFVTDEGKGRGVLFRPTGVGLFAEFERSLTGPLADSPEPLASQLADGVVEQFELATSLRPDVAVADGRATFGVVDSVFGSVDRFDHPLASFVAVGLARGLDRPVEVETVTADDDRFDYLLTCRWKPSDEDAGEDQTGGKSAT